MSKKKKLNASQASVTQATAKKFDIASSSIKKKQVH